MLTYFYLHKIFLNHWWSNCSSQQVSGQAAG